MHRHAVEYSTYPRGPRSGPGCSVPVRRHLTGPIRPTRRHITVSYLAGSHGRDDGIKLLICPAAQGPVSAFSNLKNGF